MQLLTRIAALVVFACATLVAEAPLPLREAGRIRSQQRSDVEYLSSEQLRGRSVTDETIDEAADYIAGRMESIGLETELFDGTPMQWLQIPLGARAGSVEHNYVTFTAAAGGAASDDSSASQGKGAAKRKPYAATLGSGMNPLSIGISSGEFAGPVAFVGYGITAPRLSYDDYSGIDVAGRAVMMLRKEPTAEGRDDVFGGPRNTTHAFFATKISNALAHGASAVILVNDAASANRGVESKQRRLEQERGRKTNLLKQLADLPETAVNSRQSLTKQLAGVESMIGAAQNELAVAESGLISVAEAGNGSKKDKVIPVLSVSRELADRILRSSTGDSLASIEGRINQTVRPRSLSLDDWQVDLSVELEPTVADTANVVGVLPGRGSLGDESVVVGAHYDHVGMGGFGSLAPGTNAVHNGADDNASGVAVLLAAAEKLSARLSQSADRRRIIFIAFTGEERGLVGSKHYAKYPRYPLDKTVAMINLDMVGRLRDNELTLYGTGSGVGMNDLVDRLNVRHGFDIFKVDSGYGPSDHQSFYEMGVPVLFFFTGLHNDYHRPTDDFGKIDFGGMARITDMVSDAAIEFATSQDVPSYAKTNDKVQIRRQLTVYLGVSLSGLSNRVMISSVTPGAPGDTSGIRVGDVIEKMGKNEIHKTSEVLESLRRYSPGDTMTLQLRRRGKRILLRVKLASRPGASE